MSRQPKPVVFLDPDGTGEALCCVLVEHETGVVYQQQYGGTATLQAQIEGYLVPVWSASALRELRQMFERDLKGAGTSGAFEWTPDLLDRLSLIVASIPFWSSVEPSERAALGLDLDRLASLDEALVPVVTPDGPGWLTWANSD